MTRWVAWALTERRLPETLQFRKQNANANGNINPGIAAASAGYAWEAVPLLLRLECVSTDRSVYLITHVLNTASELIAPIMQASLL